MYALIKNNTVKQYPYDAGNLRRDNQHTSFPLAMSDERLAEWGVMPVSASTAPAYDAATHTIDEGTPVLIDGVWTQVWMVRQLTAEELKARVPHEVTMRQARLALLAAGKLAGVGAAIASMPEPQRTAASIEWEYGNTLQRNNPFVSQIGAALGLDDAAIDALFVEASKL